MTCRLSITAATVAVAMACLAAPTVAQQRSDEGTWVLLAGKDVALASGSDTVDVTKAKGAFKALRISNAGEAIDISRVRVVYADNSFHIEERRINLLKGERTRPIDPRAASKHVDTVAITFKPVPAARQPARLEIYGLQDAAGAKAVRAGLGVAPVGSGGPAAAPLAKDAAAKSPGARDGDKSATAAAGAGAAAAATAGRTTTAPAETKPIKIEPVPAKGRCLGRGHLLIASAVVAPGAEQEAIKIGPRIGHFDRLRLCVSNNDIDLAGLRVRFTDGASTDLAFAGAVRAGHRTQGLDLKADRFIDRVDLLLKKKPGGASAEVEIWGELAEDYLDERAKLYDDGWIPLVSLQPARFVGFTVDKEEPGRHKSGFSQVRILARDRDITADYVTLTFADGKTQRFDLNRLRVENGRPSSALAVEGGRKVITSVEARYRSRFFDPDARGRDKALVEIWGKR